MLLACLSLRRKLVYCCWIEFSVMSVVGEWLLVKYLVSRHHCPLQVRKRILDEYTLLFMSIYK